MASPIRIDVVTQADVKDLQGLGKTLDDVADNGESMGEKIEQSLKDMEAKARPTNSEFKALARALDDLATASGKSKTEALDDLKNAAQDAGDAIDDGVLEALERIAKQGESDVEKAVKALRDLKSEAKKVDDQDIQIDVDIDKDGNAKKQLGSLKEDVAASGNESGQELAGSMMDGFNGENIVEGLTEVVAEATENMSGPMQAAGIGLAIVLALAYAELAKIAEKTNEAKEAGGEWASSFNTADVSGRLEALREKFSELSTEIADESAWYEFGEAAETALEQIIDGAEEGGVSVKDFMKAFNEDDPSRRLEMLQDALKTTKDRTADLQDQQKSAGLFESWEIAGKTRELDESTEAIEKLAREQEIALETEEAMAEAMGLTVEQFRSYNELSDEAKERVDALAEGQKAAAVEAEAQTEATEELNDELSDMAGNARDAAKAEIDLAEQLSETNETLKDSKSSVNDKRKSVLDLIDAVIDSAEAEEAATGSTRGYNRVLQSNQDELYAAGRRAGYTKEQIDRLTGGIKNMPRSAKVEVSAPGAEDSRQKLKDVLTYAGVKKDMTVGVRANTSQANADVANFRHTQQSIPISIGLRAV